MSLAEKYRPQTLEEFRGSHTTVTLLSRMLQAGNLPGCLLFSGQRGCGKSTMARLLNKTLNPDVGDPMTYIEIDAASNNGVDHVRELQTSIQYSHAGNYRIVVLDECHAMSTAAFNALLKILEEPPAKTLFVLVTTAPEALPDTVRSRAMEFRFSAIPVQEIGKRLVEVIVAEKLALRDPAIVLRIAEVADGSLRNALVLLQQMTYFDSPTVEDVNELSGHNISTKDLLFSMLSGSVTEFEGEISHLMGKTHVMDKILLDLSETLKELHKTGVISSKQFLACMEVTWNLRRVSASSDMVARSQLEAGLFFMFSKVFWDGQEADHMKEVPDMTPEDFEKIAAAS